MADRALDIVGVVNDLRARVARLEALGAARWGATADESWHLVGGGGGEPAFSGTWVNFGSSYQPLRFRRERNRVFVEGTVKSGTNGTTVFTLPAAYRPLANQQRWGRGANSVDQAGYADVNAAAGTIALVLPAGTGAITAFSTGFDFPVD